ncbi:hypothetical protein MIR68_004866 [Amoeboaphelidium protococcarum]|nr:hypothetical protein MIR68_004866 [Amoeboaphelidium protococcarum]
MKFAVDEDDFILEDSGRWEQDLLKLRQQLKDDEEQHRLRRQRRSQTRHTRSSPVKSSVLMSSEKVSTKQEEDIYDLLGTKLRELDLQYRRHTTVAHSGSTRSDLRSPQSFLLEAQRSNVAKHNNRKSEQSAEDQQWKQKRQERDALIKQALQKAQERDQELKRQLQAKEKERLAQEKKRQEEEAAKLIKQKEAEAAEQQRLLKEKQMESMPYHGPADVLQQYQQYLDFVLNVKKVLKPQIDSNRQMANEARRYRMQITVKTGAVVNSKSHIRQFYQDLNDMFSKAKQVSPDLLYPYLLEAFAKAVTTQAMREVSVNLSKAFPLAALIQLMLCEHPLLLQYLLGKMYKKCIYVVPAYAKRLPSDQNGDDDLRARMRMKKVDGKWESDAQYQERMAGIVALFTAITVVDPTQFTLNVSNPAQLSLKDLWSYMARLLNQTPRKITPNLLEIALKLGGHQLLRTYGQQAHKLIQFIDKDYMSRIKSEGTEAAKTRLLLLLEDYRRQQTIPAPEGAHFRD